MTFKMKEFSQKSEAKVFKVKVTATGSRGLGSNPPIHHFSSGFGLSSNEAEQTIVEWFNRLMLNFERRCLSFKIQGDAGDSPLILSPSGFLAHLFSLKSP